MRYLGSVILWCTNFGLIKRDVLKESERVEKQGADADSGKR